MTAPLRQYEEARQVPASACYGWWPLEMCQCLVIVNDTMRAPPAPMRARETV